MSIPPTDRLRKGKLDCGLQYYVLGRDVARPKHAVELRLIVKVGSLMESQEEQGLAHFIEHLGFKGTENFAKYELVRFLQSLGVQYGADLNASTHLLETTFQLSTEIDSEADMEKFQHAVSVLKEWAFHMRIDEHDVTEEKSVIHAEYVSKQGLGERLLAKYWSAVFNDPSQADCRLAKRMPIGIPEVFMNTNAKQIREFYEKWYVPEHMALVVVGDFSRVGGDAASIIDVLERVFHPIACRPAHMDPVATGSVSAKCPLVLPRHHCEDTVLVLCDKELSASQLSCEFFLPCPSEASHDYLRQDIVRRLICSIYDRRLHAISSGGCSLYGAETPFISAGISIRQIVRGLLCFGVSATIASDEAEGAQEETEKIQTALTALLREMKRFSLHGASQEELEAAKSNENYYARRPGSFRVLCGQFPSRSDREESALSDDVLRGILGSARELVTAEERNILPWVRGGQIEPTTVLEAARRAIEARERGGCPPGTACLCCVGAAQLLPPGALCAPVSMPPPAPPTPSPTAVSTFDNVDVTEIVLSNGITVALKWMADSCPNKVSMQAFALGGSTELSEAEEIVMSRLDSIAEQSYFDVGGSLGSDLQSRTKTYVSTQRHHNHRGLGGSCPSSNFELLLAFVALKLTSQRILSSAVEKNIALVRSELANMHNSPEAQFMEKARLLSCGDIPISRPVSAAAIDAISLDMAADLYERGFLRDPTEFTFVFVGDMPSLAETTALLEKYIASLRPVADSRPILPWVKRPSVQPAEPFTPLPAVFPMEPVRDELQIRQAEKSSVLKVFRRDIPVLEGTLENVSMCLDTLCRVVEIKLLDYLRIQLGKVYNVVVDHSRNSLSTFTLLTIGFHCEPGDCALIEDALDAVISHMQEVGPEEASLEGVKEAMVKKHTRDLESSSHWLFWILDAYKDKAY
ncbi:unnamed protein product, partial [Ectocarpus fasciculatus]